MPFHIPIQFQGILSTITLLDVLDILIVALILYKLYMMLQDTRAITLVGCLCTSFTGSCSRR